MPILDTFRKESWGSWKSLRDFGDAVDKRDPAALSALGAALGYEPTDQKELGAAEADLLVHLAGDLKVAKGARLAAARCVLEAGTTEKQLGDLFVAAGDLLTDPRLGGKARQLAESGLPAALKLHRDYDKVGQHAGEFARAAFAASSVIGATKVKELLAAGPAGNAGANAARFTLGDPLPEAEKGLWQALLTEQCTKSRKAPAAAKRLGLAPPWPPFLPDAFAPLIKAAEEASKDVTTTDALAVSRPVRPPPGSKVAEAPGPVAGAAPPGPPVLAEAPASPTAPTPGVQEGQARKYSSQHLGTARPMEAPIYRAARPSTSTLLEGPTESPLGKRTMPAITPRMPGGVGAPLTQEQARAALEKIAAASGSRSASLSGATFDPLANAVELAKHPGAGNLTPAMLKALALEKGVTLPDGRTYRGAEPLAFDKRGKRLPRPDRWDDKQWEWQEPILPTSDLRAPARARVVQGPFAGRLQSLFEDRPEAVDRLCAAAHARAVLVGETALVAELTRELALPRWRGKRCSERQRDRLEAVARRSEEPQASRAAARALLAALDRLQPEPADTGPTQPPK